jgi:glycerol-3-phosphate dehydrogenase (NAD(P)+)
LGLGIASGLAWGGNAVGWFLTHAEEELVSVGEALGGTADVLRGMAGFGDLIATGFSPDSINREAGEAFARTGALSGEGEGARSLPFVVSRLGKKPLPPILSALRDVCVSKKNVRLTFEHLLSGR